MPPTWIPLCRCMQLYCEPYFRAVERWRKEEPTIFYNRIAMIDTADKIFSEYSQKIEETFEFDLTYDNPEVPLLPEVIPTPGKLFVFGGDQTAFLEARRLIPEPIFNRTGLFFQNMLLKQMAGNSDAYLENANNDTRKSIIAAIEKLFRLSGEAGRARFLIRFLSGEDGASTKWRTVPTLPLSDYSKAFIEFLNEYTINDEASKKAAKRKKESKNDDNEAPRKKSKKVEDNHQNTSVEKIAWQRNHFSVGTEVAAFFDVGDEADENTVKKVLYKGKVVKYAPPSNENENDQLYRIRWEDGDKEDYDEEQLQNGIDLFNEQYGAAIEQHESIGTMVAAYFDVPMKNSRKTTKKLYKGQVKAYFPPSAPDAKDQLYHIVWQDGDEEDYDENELQIGMALYEEHFEQKSEEEEQQPPPQREPIKSPAKSDEPEEREDVAVVVAEEQVNEKEKEEESTDLFEQTKVTVVEGNPAEDLDQVVLIVIDDSPVEILEVRGYEDRKRATRSSSPRKTNSNPSSANNKKKTASSSTSALACPPAKKPKAQKKPKQSKLQYDEEEEIEEKGGANDGEWTTEHPSVGQKVSAFFDVPQGKGKRRSSKVKVLFTGTITRFGPETVPGENDQLYHVVWEDGDEEDYDEQEYQAGLQRYQEQNNLATETNGQNSSSSAAVAVVAAAPVAVDPPATEAPAVVVDGSVASPAVESLSLLETFPLELKNLPEAGLMD